MAGYRFVEIEIELLGQDYRITPYINYAYALL